MTQKPRTVSSVRFAVRGGLFGAAVLEFVLFFYEGMMGIASSLSVSVSRAAVFFVIFAAISWSMSKARSAHQDGEAE